MNATDTAREARSRNLARLRKLTIGTAALGVAATSGFGYLAAMTYTGTTTTTAATTAYTTTASATPTTPATSSTTSSTTSSATSAPTVTSTTSTAHASSGGS